MSSFCLDQEVKPRALHMLGIYSFLTSTRVRVLCQSLTVLPAMMVSGDNKTRGARYPTTGMGSKKPIHSSEIGPGATGKDERYRGEGAKEGEGNLGLLCKVKNKILNKNM